MEGSRMLIFDMDDNNTDVLGAAKGGISLDTKGDATRSFHRLESLSR